MIRPASRLPAARRRRALALPRAALDARVAGRRRPLQADLPRCRVGDPRPGVHGARLRDRLREVRELPGRLDTVSEPRRRGRAADAVLRVGAQPREPQPALEPPARHEGLLPPDAPAARRGVRAARRLRRRAARAGLPDLEVRHVAVRLGDPDGAALHPARGGDRARDQLPPRGGQRALPGRPLHDPRLPPGAAAPVRRDVRRRPDPDEVAVDPLVQPDDVRDRRLALGGARRRPAERGPGRRRRHRRRACCSSSGSPPSARRSRASRTRSDVDRDRSRLALEEVPPR